MASLHPATPAHRKTKTTTATTATTASHHHAIA
jgi:hypothetical protein